MKAILNFLFILICLSATGQQINFAEYFYDSDPGVGLGTYIPITTPADSVNITTNLPTTGLSNGYHNLFIRVRYANGQWSLYEGKSFFINTMNPVPVQTYQIVAAEYFVDTDPGEGNGTPITTGVPADSIVTQLVVPSTSLSPGYHNLFIRVKTDQGRWSLYEGKPFYIKPPNLNPVQTYKIIAAEYFIDTDPGEGNGIAISTGAPADSVNTQLNIPSAGLSVGYHNLFIRVKTDDGKWSLYEGKPFFIKGSNEIKSYPIVASEYFYDTDPGHGMATSISTGPPADSVSIATSLPTTGLAAGWHFLYVRVQDSIGRWSLNEVRPFEICDEPPVINTHPTAVATCLDDTASFNVTALGDGLAYQWKKNGIDIPGATDSSYFISKVSSADTGTYVVLVTGLCGSDTSIPVYLDVISPPVIMAQPMPQSACPGSNIIFTANVTGSNPTFQWQKNGVNIAGATDDSLFLANISTADTGSYSLFITNSCGSLISKSVSLNLTTGTVINSQPASQTVCAGDSATFSVLGGGTDLSYQWYFNNNALPGDTNANLIIPVSSLTDAGDYYVIVSSSCGTPITSQTVNLNVETVPANAGNISGPLNLCSGNTGTYSIAPVSGATFYTWSLSSGWTGNSSDTSISVTTDSSGGVISVVANNSCGSSIPSTINVDITPGPPATITASDDISFCQGDSVELAAAAGTGFLYQWKLNGADITGATDSILVVYSSGNYSVEVANNICINTSTQMAVIVDALPQPSIVRNNSLLSTSIYSSHQWFLDGNELVGETGNSINIIEPGYYTVQVIDTNGCTGIDSILIAIEECDVLVPTAFSPNGDGINDELMINNANSVNVNQLVIYDRWGSIVFETNNLTDSWNGKRNNSPPEMGVYIYLLRYSCGGEQKMKKGNITLLR